MIETKAATEISNWVTRSHESMGLELLLLSVKNLLELISVVSSSYHTSIFCDIILPLAFFTISFPLIHSLIRSYIYACVRGVRHY